MAAPLRTAPPRGPGLPRLGRRGIRTEPVWLAQLAPEQRRGRAAGAANKEEHRVQRARFSVGDVRTVPGNKRWKV